VSPNPPTEQPLKHQPNKTKLVITGWNSSQNLHSTHDKQIINFNLQKLCPLPAQYGFSRIQIMRLADVPIKNKQDGCQWDLQQHRKEWRGRRLIFATIFVLSYFIKWQIKQTEEVVTRGNGYTSHLMSTQGSFTPKR